MTHDTYNNSGREAAWIPLAEAAKLTPYSAEYLSLLARKRRLTAKKIDGTWHTTPAIVASYLQEQAKRAEVLNRNPETYRPFIASAAAPAAHTEPSATTPAPELAYPASVIPPIVPAPAPTVPEHPAPVAPAPAPAPSPQMLQQSTQQSDALFEEFMRKFNAHIDEQVDAQHGILFKTSRFVRRSYTAVFTSPKLFSIFLVLIVLAAILPFRHVSGFAESFFHGAVEAVRDAQTVMGFRPGTHANEILLLGPDGEVSIFGTIETEGQFRSYAKDGIAPITVSSKTKVEHLNADYLDDLDSTEFTLAFVTKNGNVTRENVTLEGTVEVGSTLLVRGATKLLDHLSVGGSLSVLGDATIQNDLTVHGTANFSTALIAPEVVAREMLTSEGGLSVHGTSEFGGRSVFDDEAAFNGRVEFAERIIGEDAHFNGRVTVEGTFVAEEGAEIGNDDAEVSIVAEEWSIDEEGDADFESLDVGGNGNFTGALAAGGGVTGSSVSATSQSATSSFAGPVSLAGPLADGSGSTGIAGYVLQSSGTGTRWVATSSLGIIGGGGGGGGGGDLSAADIDTEAEFESTLFPVVTPGENDDTADDLSNNDTDDLSEGAANLYFTDARARTALSESITGIDYATSTGIFSLASGYEIPLSASTTEWTTAYSWGDHGVAGYLLGANNLSDLTSSSTARTNLGLGTLATQNASGIAITGGTAVFDAATSTDLAVAGSLYLAGLADGCVEVAGGLLTSTGTNCGTSSGGITTLNGLTASSQSFATSSSDGLLLDISSSGSVHTFTASLATGYEIPLSASTTEWATAHSWGNHALAGYLTSVDVSDDTNLAVSASGLALSDDTIALAAGYIIPLSASTTAWNLAHSWGDHALANYLDLDTDTTDDLTEGATNLFFTNERAGDAMGALIVDGTNIDTAYDDAANTLTISATDTNTQLTEEQVEDFVGTMFGGTEQGIAVTYDDAGNAVNFVVDGITPAMLAAADFGDFTCNGTTCSLDETYLIGNETITLAGDVSGSGTTTITTVVADDSHAHTGATISGLDISDDTNLAVTATGLTLTDDTIVLSAGYEIPLSASTTEWATAHSWGDHALAGYIVAANADTEAEVEAFLTDVTDIYTNNDGALDDDDLADNSIEDLADIASMAQSTGDLLLWNGTAWTNAATSSLGFVDTDTTYTAGTGLDLAGTTFSIESSVLTETDIDTEAEFEATLFSVITPGENDDTADDLSDNDTDDLSEGTTNLYFTDTRARNTLSESIAGIDYATSTGIFSLAAGYEIPLSASTTEWATAHSWGNHALAGYLTSVEATDLAAADFGDFTCNGTSCSFDADTVSDNEVDYANVTLSDFTDDVGYLTDIAGESLEDLADVDTFAQAAGNVLYWTGTGWNVTATSTWDTDTDTTYTAGTGLNLTGTTFNVTGLTTDEFASANISQWTNDANFIDLTDLSSSATGLTYTDTTGVFSLTAGYEIPLTASTTEWSTAYSWGDHALEGYIVATNADTEAEIEAFLTDVSDIYTNNDGALDDDDLSDNDTDDLAEGSVNLYWTQNRFNTALSATTSIDTITTLANLSITESQISDLDHFTGTDITGNETAFTGWDKDASDDYTSTDFAADLALSDTDDLAEGTTNLYFTEARARNTLSETITGIDYATSTGVFSLTSGYTIPLSASTTEWSTAYSWGNHASAGYLTDITSESIEDLSDVAAMTQATGDLLLWNGTAWTNIATSSLGIASHDEVTLAGEDYLSLAGQAITANSIGPDDLASADFGDFTCSGTACSFDADTVSDDEIDYANVTLSDFTDDVGYLTDITGESFLDLSDTPFSYTANRVLYMTSNAITTDADFTFDGTQLTLGGTGLALSGTTANIALGSNYLSGDGGDEGIFVDSSGEVGIGTTAPASPLHIVHGSSATTLRLQNTDASLSSSLGFRDAGNNNRAYLEWANSSYSSPFGSDSLALFTLNSDPLVFGTFNDEKMRITDTGNVGIGTSTPGSKLTVAGDALITGALTLSGSATTTFGGDVSIAGSIIPTADITYDLGSPSRQWKDVYIGPGSLYVNGKKVIEDVSDTITFRTDSGQNLAIQTTGTGNINTEAEGSGNVNVLSGSGNININSASGNLNIGTTGVGSLNLGTIASGVWNGTDIDVSDYTNLSVSATGLTLSGDTLALASGYTIPLTASTTEWASMASQWTTSDSDIYYNGGNVGIGTTTPAYPLSVQAVGGYLAGIGDGTRMLNILSSSSGNGYVGLGSLGASHDLRLYTANNAANGITINSTGDVGIGTTTPSSQLEVTVPGAQSVLGFSRADTAQKWDIVLSGNDFNLRDVTASSTYLTVLNASGNVGIGTTDPIENLQVHGGSGESNIYLTNDSSGATAGDGLSISLESDGTSAYLWNHEAGDIYFGTSDIERLRINADGNVGIGTTDPARMLDIISEDSSTADMLVHIGEQEDEGGYLGSFTPTDLLMTGGADFVSGSWAARDTMSSAIRLLNGTAQFFTDSGLTAGDSFTPTARMIIDASGNVGIDDALPDSKLTIDATHRFYTDSEALVSTGAGAKDYVYLGRLPAGTHTIRIYYQGPWGYNSAEIVVTKTFHSTGPDTSIAIKSWKGSAGADELASLHQQWVDPYTTDVFLLFKHRAPSSSAIDLRWSIESASLAAVTKAAISPPGLDATNQIAAHFMIDNTGNVGLSRTPTANLLEVAGSASKSTAGDWLANSDRRIKDHILDAGGLEFIRDLRPVTFVYTDEYLAKHPDIEDRTYYNFIAQEFADVFPDAVKGSGEYLSTGEEILQLDTHNAFIASIRSIQELDERTSFLDATSTSPTGVVTSVLDRLVTLAEGFVDGVLKVAGIKTDELCVGNVCVDESTFLQMVHALDGEQEQDTSDDNDTEEGADDGETNGDDSADDDVTGGQTGGADLSGGNGGQDGGGTPPAGDGTTTDDTTGGDGGTDGAGAADGAEGGDAGDGQDPATGGEKGEGGTDGVNEENDSTGDAPNDDAGGDGVGDGGAGDGADADSASADPASSSPDDGAQGGGSDNGSSGGGDGSDATGGETGA